MIGIGFSQATTPSEAAFQASVQAKNQLNSVDTDLAIVFASPAYAKKEALDVVATILKPQRLVGSSAGALIVTDGIANRGFAVLGINSDEMSFGAAAVSGINTNDLHKVGFELARKAHNDLNLAKREALIIFSDGIVKDIGHFIRGTQEALGSSFPIMGGISSDDFKYKDTSQFFKNQVLSNSAVGLLLGGNITIALGNRHGFKPLGKPRTVTQVNDHIIRTIDGRPAVEIYDHFLGAEAQHLKENAISSYALLYPLGIYLEGDGQYLLRNAVDILSDGSIVCQGDIPEGSEIHLMISNKDACRQAALEAAGKVKDSLSGKQAKLVIILESLARHKIMGRSAFSEIQAIKEVLGYTTPMIGMYTYGEVAPFDALSNVKKIHLHNEHILLIAIG